MEKLDKKTSSLLDANFGRLGEGIRVLEDIARFILRDYEITKRLKKMRHSLLSEGRIFNLEFLNSRGEDIGTFLFALEKAKRKNFLDLVSANAKRVEEALRVLEEYFKFLGRKGWQKFQKNRFLLYNLEKEIISQTLRQEKIKKIFPLYVILDAKYFEEKNAVEILKRIIKGGVRAVQYRDKKNNKRKVLRIASNFKKICEKAKVLFLINDYVDIALSLNADGVHLGKEDLPVSIAREILPFDKIIGCSVHTLEEAKKAEKEKADYLSVGAIFPTTTKEDAILVKPSLIKEIKNKVSLPVIAIGGINESNLEKVLKLGVKGIAVSQAVMTHPHPQRAVKRILSKIKTSQSSININSKKYGITQVKY